MKKLLNKKTMTTLCIIIVCIILGVEIYKGLLKIKNLIEPSLNSINNSVNTLNQINKNLNSISNNITKDSNYIDDSLSSINLKLEINGYPVDLNMKQSNITVFAKSLNVEVDNIIKLDLPKESDVFVNGELYKNEIKIKLEKLSKQDNILIEIYKDNGDYRKIIIPTLPETFPQLEVGGSGYTNLKGDYYADVHRSGDSYVYKMSLNGEIKYYYRSTNKTGSVNNFKKLSLNNKVYYSFFEAVDDFNKITNVGIEFGEIVLLDSDFKEVKRIQLEKTNKVPQGGYVENHDYIFLDIDHYILLSEKFSPIQLSDGNIKEMRSTYIQEVKNSKVIFEWLSSDYNVLNNSYTFLGMERDEDYMHTNSIEIDKKDNNLLLSNRHQDSVIKINRKTGEILWTLGGKNDDFNLNKKQLLSKQHYAYLDFNNNILLFDNGNNDELTKIKVFELNEDKKQVVDYSEYTFGNKFSSACGNVQQISDDFYLIGWGFSSNDVIATIFDFKNNKVVSEVVSSINTIYRIQYYE